MPISGNEECTTQHWDDVKRLLIEASETAGYSANLVSSSLDATIIQKNIVENLYNNEIIVCDVSTRNPNVMFELGMRLAFDKPVVIVKDELTPFTFDMGMIEHITYPRSLSYFQIEEFKRKLSDKIRNTVRESKKEGYSPFLKFFGGFEASTIKDRTEEGVLSEILLQISAINNKVNSMYVGTRPHVMPIEVPPQYAKDFIIKRIDEFCSRNGIKETDLYGNQPLRLRLVDFITVSSLNKGIAISPEFIDKVLDEVILPF